MVLLAILMFLYIWLFILFWQFRSPENYDGYIDMKNYTFCSNLRFHFPKYLIGILFFNHRLTKIPFPIVLQQIMNYAMMILFCLCRFCFHMDQNFLIFFLKIWGGGYIILLLVMMIDHEIYCFRKK